MRSPTREHGSSIYKFASFLRECITNNRENKAISRKCLRGKDPCFSESTAQSLYRQTRKKQLEATFCKNWCTVLAHLNDVISKCYTKIGNTLSYYISLQHW
nr:MAG TPA: hypothetical protein [Caudoviricetes sp.]